MIGYLNAQERDNFISMERNANYNMRSLMETMQELANVIEEEKAFRDLRANSLRGKLLLVQGSIDRIKEWLEKQ
jgi:hypothetical protein